MEERSQKFAGGRNCIKVDSAALDPNAEQAAQECTPPASTRRFGFGSSIRARGHCSVGLSGLQGAAKLDNFQSENERNGRGRLCDQCNMQQVVQMKLFQIDCQHAWASSRSHQEAKRATWELASIMSESSMCGLARTVRRSTTFVQRERIFSPNLAQGYTCCRPRLRSGCRKCTLEQGASREPRCKETPVSAISWRSVFPLTHTSQGKLRSHVVALATVLSVWCCC